jgi:hypothetical protein
MAALARMPLTWVQEAAEGAETVKDLQLRTNGKLNVNRKTTTRSEEERRERRRHEQCAEGSEEKDLERPEARKRRETRRKRRTKKRRMHRRRRRRQGSEDGAAVARTKERGGATDADGWEDGGVPGADERCRNGQRERS